MASARLLRDCELVNQILVRESFSALVNTGPLQFLAKGKGLSTPNFFPWLILNFMFCYVNNCKQNSVDSF